MSGLCREQMSEHDTALAGKAAIVTGASRGIGRACALALARDGVRVAAIARTEAQLEALTETIAAEGGEALAIVCDVAEPHQIRLAVERCKAQFGAVDILVNNAGIFVEGNVADIALADWERILRVNITAPFLFCQQVLPLMASQGGGKIVNIASTAGTQGYVYQSAYCASKHALIGFSRCLALEAKPRNVHVHILCPGGVRTDFVAGTYLAERLDGQTLLEPEDIARLVLFVVKQPDNVDLPEIIVRRCHREHTGSA